MTALTKTRNEKAIKNYQEVKMIGLIIAAVLMGLLMIGVILFGVLLVGAEGDWEDWDD